MRRILTFLIVAMAFLGTVAQVEITMGEPTRAKARVEPTDMYLTCVVGETVTDTVYVYNLSTSNIDPLCGFNSSPGYIWTNGNFGNIPPGGVGKSVVTYTPEAAGTHTASLTMNIGGEYYSVHFTGVATEPNEMTDAPVITYTYDDQYYYVTAYGNGTVLLYCDGELVDNPCVLVRDEYERLVTFAATAQEPGKYISETTILEVLVEPLDLPYLPTPMITWTMDDDYVYVYGEGVGGDEYISLYINGALEDNPCSLQRTDETYSVEAMAYATMDGYQSSWDVKTIEVPAKVAIEQAVAPVIHGTGMSTDGYLVEITCAESGADIYYRLEVISAGEWIIGEWTPYDEAFVITEIGHYKVEAYASVPGKLDSDRSALEFIIAGPTICYDFEEDGIYYSIIDDDKVSVSKETLGSKSYSGVVNIPNTVTHDGVTYMVTAISDGAFRDCVDLTAVTIGDYVTEINNNAFRSCHNLTSIELGDYVIYVGDAAFFGCIRLESVTLGKGLNHLGRSAFASCTVLADVTCKAATPPTMVNMNAFENSVYQSATLHVYPAVADSYKSTAYWSSFTNVVGEEAVSPKQGDTNGDGLIDINDVTNIINRVLTGNW